MDRKSVLKNMVIRDLEFEDVDRILDLIKSIYGNSYIEKEFYNRDVLFYMVRTAFIRNEAAFKGAFINNELIGQMLALIENKTVILRLAMVKKEYQNMGIINELSKEMIKEIARHNMSEFKAIYAFIDSNNSYIIRILEKYKFKRIGKTPNHDEDKNHYLIYNMMVFDLNDKIIKPNRKISDDVLKIVKDNSLPRIYSEIIENITIPNDMIELSIYFVRHSDFFPRRYNIFLGTELLGTFLENIYDHTWYNLRINRYIPLNAKIRVIKQIIDLFETDKNIHSMSYLIEIDDSITQELLINHGLKFYGFLPFYYDNKDYVLFGVSKYD